MAITECFRGIVLGYSGGAVPELHRSSLFVGGDKQLPPTTNAHLTSLTLTGRFRVVKRRIKKLVSCFARG